ncbi:MAG: hypothetical protein ACE14M_02440 [Terriglobales bacterium]
MVVSAFANKPEADTRTAVERRRWARLPLAVPVFLRGIDEGGAQFLEFSTALNVSAGGVLVAARRHVPPLIDISVEIPSAPAPTPAAPQAIRIVKAKFVRDLVSDHTHLIALKFTRPLQ